MTKFKCQIKPKAQMLRDFRFLTFNIHLAFACLREAASAKAGILKLWISLALRFLIRLEKMRDI
jgi:hypothetical protein